MKTLRLAPALLLATLQIAALVTEPVKMLGQQPGRSFEQFAQFEMKLDGWRTQNYDRQSHNYEILQPAQEGWPLLVDNCASLPKKAVELENPKTRPDGKPLPPLITRNVSYYPPKFAFFEWSIRDTGPGGSVSTKKLPVTSEFVEGTGKAMPCRTSLTVKDPGRYEVTLKIYDEENRPLASVSKIKTVTRRLTIVSIGDSLASGEGNPDTAGSLERNMPCKNLTASLLKAGIYSKVDEAFDLLNLPSSLPIRTPAVWLEPLAHRSQRGGFAGASRLLDDGGTLVTFLNFATSGAKIDRGLLKYQHDWQDSKGQLHEIYNVLGSRRIDALVVSIGANDVGFSGALRKLALNSDADKIFADASAWLSKIPQNLAAVDTTIAGMRLNVGKIYLTEYPTAFFDKEDGKVGAGCDVFETCIGEDCDLQVTLDEARRIRQFADTLNQTLRAKANELGWTFVDGIAVRFTGRGYCTGAARRYFVTAEESCLTQGDFDGMMHPNRAGHRVYAEKVAEAIRKEFSPPNTRRP